MKRLSEIDVLQGIAMILVVLGHHFADIMPPWYNTFRYYLYIFHMPVFIFISGFLIRYSYKEINTIIEYKNFVIKRCKKFIPWYLFISLVCMILTIDDFSLDNIATETYKMIFTPKQSSAAYLWYIYMLLQLYFLTPLFVKATKLWTFVIGFIGFIGSIHYLKTSLFNLDYFSEFFIYFFFGFFIAPFYGIFKKLSIFFGDFFLCSFIILSIFHFRGGYNLTLEIIIRWTSIPTFYYLAVISNKLVISRNILTFISKHSFSIYLFHMFIVQLGIIIIQHLCGKLSLNESIIYLVCSITISILISANILRSYSTIKERLKHDFNSNTFI